MHECRLCGIECDCDGEDMSNPQPANCPHLDPSRFDVCEVDGDDEDGDEELDDSGRPLDWNDDEGDDDE
jgi:hypothetical protein